MTLFDEGPPRYCYVSEDGLESPTLRVHPGHQLIIHFKNDLPPVTTTSTAMQMAMPQPAAQASDKSDCSGGALNVFVTNLHFHGLTVPPICHQDDVTRTLIQPGQGFEYRLQIPQNEPPGLYWYHPHPHGFSERQVQGGASGGLIVEGIEDLYPSLRGLRQRLIVLRDQPPTHPGDSSTPAWDISINYVPVIYPQYEPAKFRHNLPRGNFGASRMQPLTPFSTCKSSPIVSLNWCKWWPSTASPLRQRAMGNGRSRAAFFFPPAAVPSSL